MDPLHVRLDALEHPMHSLQQQTHTLARRLRWWRGLACGLVGLAVLTWALPSGTAQGTLEQRVAALEAKLVKLTFEAATNEVVITGANLHIVNGPRQHRLHGRAKRADSGLPERLGQPHRGLQRAT